ncbi:uncharacterized protein LOC135485850 [Lineus longissimus]|uniref:uncharacterized protein LOC135485850 n=1 Tax=Lineus longissimus TaxID=88925 RepID=UPI002B4F5D45
MANFYYSDGMPAGNAWQQQSVYYQQPRPRQQPQTAVIRQPEYSQGYSADEDFAAAASKGLGVLQVVCGILGIILGILMINSCAYRANDAIGIWCGVFIMISGAISIAAAHQRSRELIIVSLIFSILLSILFSFAMFLAAAVALGKDDGVKTYVYAWFACSVPNSTSIVWDTILMIVGLLSWVCAFAQCIICCKSKAVCGGHSNNVGAVVTYVNQPQVYGNCGYNMGPPPFHHHPQPPEYSQHFSAAPPPAYRPPTAWSEPPHGERTAPPAPTPQAPATAPTNEPPPPY